MKHEIARYKDGNMENQILEYGFRGLINLEFKSIEYPPDHCKYESCNS